MDGPKGIVVLAGGRGFIGSYLRPYLVRQGWDVKILTRKATVADGRTFFTWDPARRQIDDRLREMPVGAVVNLAGENIAGRRWTRRFREALYRSRMEATGWLVTLSRQWQPRTFVQLTGIGYYGYDRGEEWLPESASPGEGFLARLSLDWERAALPVKDLDTALFIFRTGVVLGRQGGMIARLMPLALLNLLSPMGNGRQWMSWIHIEDLAHTVAWALDRPGEADVYNVCAPHPVRNKTFTYHWASSINKSIFLPNVPRWALRLVVGEMEKALTGSLRVDARRLNDRLSFRYPHVEAALRALSPVKH